MDGVLVVKIGGSARPDRVLDNVATLRAAGTRVVLVHGGGPAADRLAAQLGVSTQVVQSPDGTRSRRTDAAALDAVTMALLGRVKPALVGALRGRGVTAVGLSGADGGLVAAERKQAIRSVENGRIRLIRDDRSGRVTQVRPDLLHAVLAAAAVPVVSPPAASPDGQLLNVDADQLAARIAIAVGADALVLLTDVPGVLRDRTDTGSLIRQLSRQPRGLTGRMRHKVRAAVLAQSAVRHVVIGSAVVERPIDSALAGVGTVVTAMRGEST
jgi:acetylglutamate/LysW-gamma-L-alpha-aminoadipate kinase